MKAEKKKESAKKSPYLHFDPSKVTFDKDVRDNVYKAKVGVLNNCDKHVAVKVKTNAPDSYVVRPNVLLIAPFTKQELFISCKHTLAIVLSPSL